MKKTQLEKELHNWLVRDIVIGTTLWTLIVVGVTGGLLTGCSHGTLDAGLAKIQTAPILDRHDAYVNADESLSPGEKSKYLKTSANWRASLEKALAPDEPVQ